MISWLIYLAIFAMAIAVVFITIRKFVPSFTMRVPSLNGRVTQWTGGMGRFMTGPNHKTARAVTFYFIGLIVILVLIAKLLPTTWNAWMDDFWTFVFGVLAITMAASLPYVHNKKTVLRTSVMALLLLLGVCALIYSGEVIQQIIALFKAEVKADDSKMIVVNRTFTSDEVMGTFTIHPGVVSERTTPVAKDSFMLTITKGTVSVGKSGYPLLPTKEGVSKCFGPDDKINLHLEDYTHGSAVVVIRSFR